MRARSTIFACAATALITTATAQQSSSEARASLPTRAAGAAGGGSVGQPATVAVQRVPIHSAEPDSGVEYGIWAAGRDYKVGFAGDMTFIPYLGTDYPHNQPLSWRTESVRLGSAELLGAGELPKRWHSEFRYEYRYEAFTEAYDVLEEGLEQTFVLYRRPAVAGDLVVRGRIETALRGPSFAGERRAVAFSDHHGDELIRYGVGTVVDAAGRTGDVLTSYENGHIALTVPQTWLRDAVYPVTIDPLLTPVTLSSGVPHLSVDVARNDTTDDVVIVFGKAASGFDVDGFAFITLNNLTFSRLIWSDVTSSWSTPHLRVACSDRPQKTCIVLERRIATTNAYRIRFHLRDYFNTAFSSTVTPINPPSGEHNWRPDIGGHVDGNLVFPTGRDFLIVYQRESTGTATFQNTARSGIRARALSSAGVLGGEILVTGFVPLGYDYERPSVNRQARQPGVLNNALPMTWMVVYQAYNNNASGDDWDVVGKLVDSNGQVQNTTWNAPGNGDADHRLAPRVAGQHGRYLVAYTRTNVGPTAKTAQDNGKSLVVTRVDWTRGSAPTRNGPERILYGPFTGDRMQLGAVAYDHNTASHWAITSASLRNHGGTGRTIIDRVGFNGLSTEARTLEAAAPNEQGRAGGVFFDEDNGRFLVGWAMNTGGTNGAARVNQLLYVTPLAPQLSGIGCSSASISWVGPSQIGSEFPSVDLTNAPANQLAILLLAFGQQDLNLSGFGMVGCRLLVLNSGPRHIGTVFTTTDGAGESRVPVPLPEHLLPAILYMQWFHTAPGANPSGFTSTQRLRVQIVK